MRWNGRERATGELVAVGVFGVGAVAAMLAADPAAAAARVHVGMTQPEAAAALGTPGRQNFVRAAHLYSPRDLDEVNTPEYRRALNPTESKICWDFALPDCEVQVSLYGPEGRERVAVVEGARRVPRAGVLLPLALAAAAAGCAAAEVARRRLVGPSIMTAPSPHAGSRS